MPSDYSAGPACHRDIGTSITVVISRDRLVAALTPWTDGHTPVSAIQYVPDAVGVTPNRHIAFSVAVIIARHEHIFTGPAPGRRRRAAAAFESVPGVISRPKDTKISLAVL